MMRVRGRGRVLIGIVSALLVVSVGVTWAVGGLERASWMAGVAGLVAAVTFGGASWLTSSGSANGGGGAVRASNTGDARASGGGTAITGISTTAGQDGIVTAEDTGSATATGSGSTATSGIDQN
ncbi:hypothetical protein [Streptomyces bohaiensis]|uniref:Uncharacterized protein n=1 Tax=Streptomyces bohaiensis TaxID=1431344 RepID=A0ABX1C2L1_9ACTN|nr:hypothetical protein [Streptomyces bohaiensis]NJQ13485.1 hypothetical protein [Streptomyces bohaiensis]